MTKDMEIIMKKFRENINSMMEKSSNGEKDYNKEKEALTSLIEEFNKEQNKEMKNIIKNSSNIF